MQSHYIGLFVQCNDKDSECQHAAVHKYPHLQNPEDPVHYCYECTGLVTTPTA